METTPRRSSNIAGMLMAGKYSYVDHPGSEPQLVEVRWELGLPIVRFLDAEPEDAGIEMDARDMSGTFTRLA